MLSADKFSLVFVGETCFFWGGWWFGAWGGIDFSLGWFDQLKSTQIGGVESCGKWWDCRGNVQGLYTGLLELPFHSHPISEL